ncbi:zinc finger, AN1-type domain, partial [Cladochytrium tenue]
ENCVVCHKLSFLPLPCPRCRQRFCETHFKPADHNCAVADPNPDAIVVECPVCGRIVPVPREQLPDGSLRRLDPNRFVEDHIAKGCPDPGTSTVAPRKVNKCAVCPKKEAKLVECRSCHKSFCLAHRHESDHRCQGKPPGAAGAGSSAAGSAAAAAAARRAQQQQQQQQQQKRTQPQPAAAPNTDGDEELARALQLSLYENERSGAAAATPAAAAASSSSSSGCKMQ